MRLFDQLRLRWLRRRLDRRFFTSGLEELYVETLQASANCSPERCAQLSRLA